MLGYILRRILYAIPVILVVNLVTFMLFFNLNSPDDMARMQLGNKHVTTEAIQGWKKAHGYDKPIFYNQRAPGWEHVTQTLFFQKSLKMLVFDFGMSDANRNIGSDLRLRMGPSLAIAIPSFILGIVVNILVALYMVLFRETWIERTLVISCIILMSISTLFYIIFGQFIVAKWWHWVPLSGYSPGWSQFKFVILPILIAILSSLGANARWYRAVFLEEANKEYVQLAKAKGLSSIRILLSHVLPNGALPILTGVVVLIPSLFLGSLLLESFFGIPGLGSYTIDAILQQDFAIVRVMVYLGTVLYIIGLILTDLAYSYADPRVRLE
ncbi:MAG: ABC transporter permease [Gammaproteobacteria bacterium]|nr:ABC transporter permease [Gammaproteobacteria bacterium]